MSTEAGYRNTPLPHLHTPALCSSTDGRCMNFTPKTLKSNHIPAVTRGFHVTATGDNVLGNRMWKIHTDALKAYFFRPCG